MSKLIDIIFEMRQYFDRTTLKNLYYTFFFPYLTYCCEIWGNTAWSYLDPMINLQNFKRIVSER